MASAAVNPSLQSPLPEDLPKLLHSPKTPWQISPALFQKMAKQFLVDSAAGKKFVAVELTNQDPEFAFVYHYFQHQKPPHYAIKKILCLHNPSQTKMFESSFDGMEAAAKTFAPGWKEEEPKAHRAQTMERWNKSAAVFSPFQIPSANRVDIFTRTKIIPLWHGSKHVDSICNIGFTFFGKHHFFDKTAKTGAQASTDIGYFGSGIYFTNSAQYASMYNSGTLVLSWVSMREPYPVVNDVSIPHKGSDMKKLQGKGAYQNYNAHYIPVTSIDPKEPDNMVYHPCQQTEQPAWDEYVVFQANQALPRFVVELGVDLPMSPSASVPNSPSAKVTVETMTDQLQKLLDYPALQSDEALIDLLTKKLDTLLDLDAKSALPTEEVGFFNRLIKLIDVQGKVSPTILKLIKQPRAAATVVLQPGSKEERASLAKVVKKEEPASPLPSVGIGGMNQKTGYVYPSVPAAIGSAASSATVAIQAVSPPPLPPKPIQKPKIAFGAEQWKKYFGDVGKEPPLPANIQEILNSPCPFIKGKKKEETHLLVLIPATLNGQPMTLVRLGAIMKARDSKLNKRGYRHLDAPNIDTPFKTSHWVLMTKDVIEGSRKKSYDDQKALLARYPGYQAPRLSGAVTSIYMHYVVTGQRLYTDAPYTFTRCQEWYDDEWQMVVGGFASAGLSVDNDYADVGSVGVAGLWKF